MDIRLTSEVEKERNAQPKQPSPWEHLKTESLVEAVHKARDMGWRERKVQVRAEQTGPEAFNYYVEPYEKGCGCRGLLKYNDYF
jgi:hypothetical protein